jgi:hypothetical protein
MDVFDRLDVDRDGSLSDAEAGADAGLLARFAQIDVDDDRRLSSEEYAAAMAPRAQPLQGAPPFETLDSDRSGSLTADELMAPGAGRSLLDLDVDRDGRVSAEEYLQAPRSSAPDTTLPGTGSTGQAEREAGGDADTPQDDTTGTEPGAAESRPGAPLPRTD